MGIITTCIRGVYALHVLSLLVGLYSCSGTSKDKPAEVKVTELDTISYENLSEKAYNYLAKQQEVCAAEYGMGSYENWYYDQYTGKLTFSTGNVPKLIVDYEQVGSVSLASNTWLWAWDNKSVEPKVKTEIAKLKTYGERRQFYTLANAKWTADETDGWQMTAIAAYIMQAKGAYRVPTGDGQRRRFQYMVFKSIERVE